jgi:ribonucleoside-diphosphate reductase alpha chain
LSLPKHTSQDELYSFIGEYLIAKSSHHYFYDLMAARIATRRLHNITSDDLLVTASLLQENLDKNGDKSPILSDEVFDIIARHHARLQEAIDYDRDYSFDYFGVKTLERSYLYKLHFTKFKIIERPQHLFMRVALGIHGQDIDAAIETYDLLSLMYCTHATPTLFNSGTRRAQMSSCFLQAIDDSIESIFDAVRDIAFTSKWSGGIGVHLSALRSRGSLIRGTNGLASGITPLCVLLNKLAKYINQGGKRNGSIACYLEPHHADIFEFCDLRKNTGNDDNRARDLFLALWISDLFMKRVEEDGIWSLMCPDECPGLNQVHGSEYVKLYEKYESEGRFVRQVKAQELFLHILVAQSETGFPYVLFKDHANSKSNQKNLGTIRSSNLCAEIIEYSDEQETAVCFTEDTDIITSEGVRKIVDCDGKNVLSYFDNDKDLRHKEHFEKAKLINNGKKQTFEIKTKGHRPIKTTADHPFLVNDNNKYVWKKISELKAGDVLVTPTINPIPEFNIKASDNVDKEWALKGEKIGSAMELFDYDNICIEEWLFKGRDYCTIPIINNETKNGTSKQISNFLKGVFSQYSQLPIINNTISLRKKCVDTEMLYDIQSMLLPFGINSSVDCSKSISEISINGTKNIKQFIESIGLSDTLMREYNNIFNESDNKGINSDSSVIEYIKKLGVTTVYDLSLPLSHNFMANGHVVHNCNLASLCLPKFIETDKDGKKRYNYQKLMKVCRVLVRNLDKVIDRNYYPTEKTKRSNFRHRPIGIGVQGLADVYNIMGFSFASDDAYDLNKRIFESIYYACIDESKELAKRFGAYSTFKGSPASYGLLQFHMWGKSEKDLLMGFDWEKLIDEVKKYGLRNSLTTSLMPTASTSQIMGNSECIEPYMSNIFKRSTLAGEFIVVNKNLMKDLLELELWDDDMRKRLIIENGSVQNIDQIPENLRNVYLTAFELKQMHIVRQAADRGEFIDQSQSMNVFMAKPNFDVLTSVLFDGHKRGLKTGMYYYRSLPAVNPINFGIDVQDIKRLTGRDATIEMISDSYSINKSENDEKKIDNNEGKVRKVRRKIKDGETTESSVQEGGYCKRRPGVKMDDCASCGA